MLLGRQAIFGPFTLNLRITYLSLFASSEILSRLPLKLIYCLNLHILKSEDLNPNLINLPILE
jgi:hypothetical protein